jgi:uncharacterized damage-inducible protein DinB
MTDVIKLLDQAVSRFVRGATETSTLAESLDRVRIVRKATLELLAGLSQQQVDFSPARGKWSIAQIVDHLTLIDGLYQPVFRQMIERARAGNEEIFRIDIRQMDPTVAYIPRAIMPFVAPAFSLFSTLVPHPVREAVLRLPLIPSGAPTLSMPRPGLTVDQLRTNLAEAFEATERLVQSGLPPSFERMRAEHPVLGVTTPAQFLDLMSAHEERHQRQIRAVMSTPGLPA